MEARFAADHVLFQHKAAGVKQQVQIDIAVGNVVNRRAGVNTRQPFAELVAVARHVSFGEQNAIGVAHLRLGDGELIHLLVGVHRVNQRNHAIQQIAFTQHIVREKGLDDRAGVGHAGAFDHQPVKSDVSAIAAVEQIEQGVFQLVGAGTADTAVGQGFNLRGAIADKLVIDGDFAKFIFDNGNFKAVPFVQNMTQQGGFTRAKKTGQQGDCNRCHVYLH